jgi:amino acid adenylation domain-containing protein
MPASFAQARLWFLDQFEAGTATYNVPVMLRLDGALDADALERAVRELVARHETLRTTFVAIDGEPHQVIHATVDLRLDRHDATSEDDARELVRREVHAPFDLSTGPVVRATLVRLAPDRHVFVLVIHHVATDGWSMGVLVRELSALYAAFADGEPSPLAPPAFDYADFAVWQRGWLKGEALERQLAFWKEHLAGAPAALELPTDRPRPATKQHRGDRVPVALPPELSDRVRQLCRGEGATPFMVLLAAFQCVLSRWSRQQDVVVGTPIANRTQRELEDVVGFFVNTLALRTSFEGAPSFRDALRRVKQSALAAYAHQDVPFEKLVDELGVARDTSRTPVFQAMFAMQNVEREELSLGDLRVSPARASLDVAKFDVSLALAETAEGLRGSLEFDVALFDRETVERLGESFVTLLDAATRAPETKVMALPLMSEAQRRRVLLEWNATERARSDNRTVHGLFEAQVDRTPDTAAVEFEGVQRTYRELDARANRVARWLLARGVGAEDRVAVEVKRSADMLAAVLGVMKAAAAYVPVDPAYPEDRKSFMKDDAAVAASLTEETLREALAFPSEERPPCPLGPHHAAYVLYTSGSTGRPKGVIVSHGNVANLLASLARSPGLSADVTTLSLTPLTFDVSVAELFLPLAVGARVVLGSTEDARDPAQISAIVEATGARRFGATPATWRMMTSAGWRPTAAMEIHCAGEALAPELADALLESGATLWNLYGPTETTVYASGAQIPPGERITIGRPLDNTRLYVLDPALQPTPIGVAGELCVAGAGVTRGYLGRPALTADKFVPDPFASKPGARMYRTGDLARWLPDGTIDYLGRIDDQVKIRGYRIELGEIESALSVLDDVHAAVVMAREDVAGDKQLVAYVVTSEAVDSLKASLGTKLPEYMVPSAFVVLDALPLTPDGKVDKKALPAPDFTAAAAEYVAPRDATEEAVAAIYRDVLRLERVGVHDDFFALGGHSLRATQVVARIRAALGVELAVRALFEAPTVAKLVERLVADAVATSSDEDALLAALAEIEGSPP